MADEEPVDAELTEADAERIRAVREVFMKIARTAIPEMAKKTGIHAALVTAEVAAALFDVASRLCAEQKLDPEAVLRTVLPHAESVVAAVKASN